MKIGIIVHSQTGNTLSVARKLQEKLKAAGHSVNIENLTPVNGQKNVKDIQLEKLPDLSAYDALVLAAPVQAFSASPVMKAYLPRLPALNGKKVAVFVTKGLPFKWTGGNNAISQIKKGVEAKGGTVTGTGIISWSGNREKAIAEMIEKFGGSF
jgi:NAD(P)H dehydrogenase (quinone)